MFKNILTAILCFLCVYNLNAQTTRKIDTIKNNDNTDIVLDPDTGKVIFTDETPNRVPFFNATSGLEASAVTDTELGYVSGVTSAIQTQLDSKIEFAGLTDTCVMRATSATTIGCGTALMDTANLLFDVGASTTSASRPINQMTEAQRDLLTPQDWSMVINTDTETLNIYNPIGAEWVEISGGGAGGSRLNIIEQPSFEKDVDELVGVNATITKEETIFLDSPNNLASAKIVSTGVATATIDKTRNAEWAGLQLETSCMIKTADTGVTFSSLVDSVIQTSLTVNPNGQWARYSIPTTVGATKNGYELSIDATSKTVYIDECRIQPIEYQQISSAHFVGSLEYNAANCLWLSTTGTLQDFPVDADCNASSIKGNVTAPDTKIPAIKILNARTDGEYRVIVQGVHTAEGADAVCRFSLSSTGSYDNQGFAYLDTNARITNNLTGSFKFSTGGDKQVSILVNRFSGTNACGFTSNTNELASKFTVTFHPDKTSSVVAQNVFNDIVVEAKDNSNEAITSLVTDIPFTTELKDTANAWDGSKFTVPETGRYSFQGHIRWNTNALRGLYIYKNGVVLKLIHVNATSMGFSNFTVENEFIAGDEVSIRVDNTTNVSSSLTHHYISIHKIDTNKILQGSFENIEKCDPANPLECVSEFSARIVGSNGNITSQNANWLSGCVRVSTGRLTCTFHAGVFTVSPACGGWGEGDFTNTVSASIVSISPTSVTYETLGTASNSDLNHNLHCSKQYPDALPKSAKISLNEFTMNHSVPGEKVVSVACKVLNSGTPVIDTPSGLCNSFISSVVDNGVGNTIINITGFTSEPVCVCSAHDVGSRNCTITGQTANDFNVLTENSTTGTDSDVDFSFTCTGKQ